MTVTGQDRAATYLLNVGAELRLSDATVRVVAFDLSPSMGLDIVLDRGDRLVRLPLHQVMSALLQDPPCEPIEEGKSPTTALDDLPEDERRRLCRRYADLRQIETGSTRGNPDSDRDQGILDARYDPQITTKSQRVVSKSKELTTRGERGVSRAALMRQLKAVQVGPEGLIHGNRGIGRSVLQDADADVVEALAAALAGESTNARISDKQLLVKCRAALKRAGVGHDVSQHRLRRLVGELTRGNRLHLEAKARERHALKPDVVYGRRHVSRPGEIVQIDATDTTIHVFDPITGWATATILSGIDVFSRCVVALRVIVGRVTSRDVSMLLLDMSRATVSRSGWPYELMYPHGVPRLVSIVDNPGDAVEDPRLIGQKPVVMPSTIVMDHGRENDSVHLLSAASRLGIEVVFCPPHAAHAKGIVESLHNTLREVQSVFAAFKGANVANHPADVEHHAMLTAADLHDALWEYILTIYHHSPHQGLADLHRSDRALTPAGVYTTSLQSGGWIEVPKDPYRGILAMSTARCLVQEYGLNVEGRRYNSEALHQLRSTLQRGVGTPARRLTVYYDRNDVSRVYARHPASGDWLCIHRAGAEASLPPCSDMWDLGLRSGALQPASQALSPRQVEDTTADLHNRWSEAAMSDKRMARIVAVERGRATQYAHDLHDLSPEFQALAFPVESDHAETAVRAITKESDDPFDDADPEDDFFDLDAIDQDGLAI